MRNPKPKNKTELHSESRFNGYFFPENLSVKSRDPLNRNL